MKRAALVGCGRIGAFTRDELRHRLPGSWFSLSHLDAMRAVPQLDVVAVSDLSSEAMARVQAKFANTRTYLNVRELLEKERPDLLAIATRTPPRLEIIKVAIGTGVRAIHAEKPLGNQMRDVAATLALCESGGIFLTYGTTRRYMNVYQTAKQLVQEGTIGELLEVQVQFGKTYLLWTHPHSVDLMLFFNEARSIRRVQGLCDLQSRAQGNLIDEDPVVLHATLEFENGVIGTLSPATGGNVLLLGSKGQIEIVGQGAEMNLRLQKEGVSGSTIKPLSFAGSPSGTQQAFMNLEQALEDGSPVGISYAEILEGMRGLLMIALSASMRGSLVCPRELPEDFTVTGNSGGLFA